MWLLHIHTNKATRWTQRPLYFGNDASAGGEDTKRKIHNKLSLSADLEMLWPHYYVLM